MPSENLHDLLSETLSAIDPEWTDSAKSVGVLEMLARVHNVLDPASPVSHLDTQPNIVIARLCSIVGGPTMSVMATNRPAIVAQLVNALGGTVDHLHVSERAMLHDALQRIAEAYAHE